ncbi:MAG: hypothetical protein ACLRZH_01570 [Ruthenibacterium lactatiformans]
MYDEARVMVATNAFGMGIDKSMSALCCITTCQKHRELLPEAGRAGRDASRRTAFCCMAARMW